MIMALLCALPLLAAEPPRILVLEPKAVNASANDVTLLQRLLVQELSRASGVVVIGSGDLSQLAELGSSKLTAGCDADACLAELADAMGAEVVVFSEVGRLGDRALWQLGLWDQRQGGIAARHTIEADAVSALGAGVPGAVDVLLGPLADRGVSYQRSDGASPLFMGGVGAVSVGVGLALIGGVGLGIGAVVVPNVGYDTGLRRGFQDAAPALVATALVGVGVAVVGGGLLVADAVQ